MTGRTDVRVPRVAPVGVRVHRRRGGRRAAEVPTLPRGWRRRSRGGLVSGVDRRGGRRGAVRARRARLLGPARLGDHR